MCRIGIDKGKYIYCCYGWDCERELMKQCAYYEKTEEKNENTSDE